LAIHKEDVLICNKLFFFAGRIHSKIESISENWSTFLFLFYYFSRKENRPIFYRENLFLLMRDLFRLKYILIKIYII